MTSVGAGPTELTGSGEVYFAVNDNYFPDNYGTGYDVTISYVCYPGNGNGDANHYHCGPPGQQ